MPLPAERRGSGSGIEGRGRVGWLGLALLVGMAVRVYRCMCGAQVQVSLLCCTRVSTGQLLAFAVRNGTLPWQLGSLDVRSTCKYIF